MAYREAAYRAEEGSALTVDKEFYDRIARAVGPIHLLMKLSFRYGTLKHVIINNSVKDNTGFTTNMGDNLA